MLQARTQFLGTQATIPPIETGLQQARNALGTLLGRPAGSLEELLGPTPGVIPAAPPTIATGAPTDLLRRRPDVRQAELAAATQSAAVGVAEADLYPSFGLSGFLGVVAADGTNTTRSGNSGAGQLFSANSLTFIVGHQSDLTQGATLRKHDIAGRRKIRSQGFGFFGRYVCKLTRHPSLAHVLTTNDRNTFCRVVPQYEI